MATNYDGPLSPSNFPGGVSTQLQGNPMFAFGMPDPTQWHTFWNDFNEFTAVLEDATTAADWTATDTNTTLATCTVIDGDGGILSVTNTAAAGDAIFFQWRGGNGAAAAVQESWRWASDKAMFFKARFQLSDATDSDFVLGLQITDATPLDVTDGLFFIKPDDSAVVTFRAEKDNTASTVTTGTLANTTYCTVAFAYLPSGGPGGIPTCDVYFNDVRVGSLTTFTNFPDDEDLAVSFGLVNGDTAAARTALLDYILVAKQR